MPHEWEPTMRTLLLSPWFVPIRVLRWQDAVKMRYEQTADVVAEYSEEIRSPSVVWKVPAVMRLRRMGKQNKRGIRFSRTNVYLRDRYSCQYCGGKFEPRDLSYDHVVPRSAGGRTDWENIVTACRTCNVRKGSKTCDEAGMFPLNRPVKPKVLPVSGPRIARESVPEEWLPYVVDVA